jgi:hypothetical protein
VTLARPRCHDSERMVVMELFLLLFSAFCATLCIMDSWFLLKLSVLKGF